VNALPNGNLDQIERIAMTRIAAEATIAAYYTPSIWATSPA
jgi:hypothetical protein